MQAFQLLEHHRTNPKLQKVDLATPHIKPHEILVQVKAAGVNPLDNLIARGDLKLLTPYKLPVVMGNECAGIVTQVGENVNQFHVGDRVFARLPIDQIGAFAHYVAIPATAAALMPNGLSFVEAAGIPLAALTALQALELMQVQEGQSIFISGGSGGLGSMAIPLAKARGLTVYTNGNKQSRDRVLALGADRYLDYRTEDYLSTLPKVNHVLDSLGGNELYRQMKLLQEGGHLVSLRGLPNGRFAQRFGLPLWKQWLLALAGLQTDTKARAQKATYDFLFVESNGAQLTQVAQWIETQRIRPSIDHVFPFEKTIEALNKVAQGGSAGKVVVELE